MTKQLTELENHYFVLSNMLLQHVSRKKPDQLEKTKQYIAKLELLSVTEKTLYVVQLLQAITSKEEKTALKQLEQVLKKENISVATISLMKQYMRILN